MWDSLTRDLVLSLVSGLIGFFAKKIWDAIKDQLHSRRIYSWMQAQSRIPGAPTFRSTKTIAQRFIYQSVIKTEGGAYRSEGNQVFLTRVNYVIRFTWLSV
jgi:hypothetical protein